MKFNHARLKSARSPSGRCVAMGLSLVAVLGLACSEQERPPPPAVLLGDPRLGLDAGRPSVLGADAVDGVEAAPRVLGFDAGSIPATGEGSDTTSVTTKRYESGCGENTRVQWGFFTYDATTPGDSNVAFRIRTAEQETGLADATWIDMARAQAVPDTQTCGFAGPLPCPIDLYELLGGSPAAHHAFAELRVEFHREDESAAPPTVQGWQLNYSCPFNQ